MKASRIALALSVSTFALLQGCASDEDGPSSEGAKEDAAFAAHQDPVFVDNAVNVSHPFSDAVDATLPTQLVLPTAGHEAEIAKVQIGSILAGDRNSVDSNPDTSKNAFGFLRKVVSIKTDGANTVITTTQAELDEWVKTGDIDFSNPNSIFTTTTGGLGTKTLHLEDTDEGGGSGSASAKMDQEVGGDEKEAGGVKFKPLIKLSNASLKVNANYNGYFKVRTFIGIPRKVEFKSLLTIDPVITTDLSIGVSVQGSGPLAIGTTNSITIAEKVLDGPGVVIPIASPIPLTVRFHPRLKCSLGAGGEISVTGNATLRSHAAVGFQGDATVTSINTTDLSQAPTLTPTFSFKGGQAKANLTAECEILAVPEVLAFDAVGLSGEIGPYIEFTANACVNANANTSTVDGGLTVTEQHGLAMNFAARAQLPVVGIGKDFPLLTVHALKSKEAFIVGDEETCKLKTEDSCSARTDGFYCSVKNTYSGIYCKGGQILSGNNCDSTTKKCVSGTQTTINCQ